MFRHGVFPDALGLIEILKISDVPMFMHGVDFLEKSTVLPVCEVYVPCNLIPFLRSQGVKALPCNLSHDSIGGIYGEESSIAAFCGKDERSIETIGKSPLPIPVGLFEKRCFICFPIEIEVYCLLLRCLKEFHGDIRPGFSQKRLKNLDLQQMIFGTGMYLSHENKAFFRQIADQILKGEDFPFRERDDVTGIKVARQSLHHGCRHPDWSDPGAPACADDDEEQRNMDVWFKQIPHTVNPPAEVY
jgi:hypothetical protein